MRWLAVLGVAALAVIVGWWTWRALHDPHGYDFRLAYKGGQVAWATGQPEQQSTWTGTPLLAAALALVTRLMSLRAAGDLLTIANTLLVIGAVAVLLRRLRGQLSSVWWWVTAAALLSFGPIMSTVWWKQFNVIALVLAAAGFDLMRHERRRPAAALIGLSVAIKPLALLLPVVMLARRETRRVGAWALVWTGGLTMAGQGLLAARAGDLGVLSPISALRNFFEKSQPSHHSWACLSLNFSPGAELCRLVGHGSWTLQHLAVWIAVAMLCILVAITLRGRAANSWETFAFVCPLSVMLSPLAWSHYQIMLVPLFVLLLVRFTSRGAGIAAWTGLAAAFVLCALMWEPYGSSLSALLGIVHGHPQSSAQRLHLASSAALVAQWAQYLLIGAGLLWYATAKARTRRPRRRVVAALVGSCALAYALPAAALASTNQETVLMDDNNLVYATPDHATHILEQIHSLGVDRVKVSVMWWLIAPDSSSPHRPHFDATDPNAYPAGAWDRFDLIARVAHQLGMGVYFEFIPTVPAWAINHHYQGGQGIGLGRAPRSGDFGRFVEAVGRRYSGSWPDPAGGGSIPRVSYWGIWNEPNLSSWLNPWHRRLKNGVDEMTQPPLYRAIVNAAWRGLAKSGHTGDTFLVGETANVGQVTPLPFVKDLYCLDGHYRPLHGRSAMTFGCPTRPNRAKFIASNPGLFSATGWAHHPYGFNVAPGRRYPLHTWVTLANIGTLERELKEVFGAYGRHRHGGIAIYLTEWGYKTNPPNPFVNTSLKQQSEWLNEGAYLAWRLPYVKQLTQFELQDFGPRVSAPKGSRAYWGTFQTGLEFHNFKRKPAYEAFRIPIWVPDPRHGHRVVVWGQLRPANHTHLQYALVQFRRHGSHKWIDLTELQTSSSKGFLYNHVAIPSAGVIRLAWLDSANGKTFDSRNAAIR